jgi:hypothetical protein
VAHRTRTAAVGAGEEAETETETLAGSVMSGEPSDVDGLFAIAKSLDRLSDTLAESGREIAEAIVTAATGDLIAEAINKHSVEVDQIYDGLVQIANALEAKTVKGKGGT